DVVGRRGGGLGAFEFLGALGLAPLARAVGSRGFGGGGGVLLLLLRDRRGLLLRTGTGRGVFLQRCGPPEAGMHAGPRAGGLGLALEATACERVAHVLVSRRRVERRAHLLERGGARRVRQAARGADEGADRAPLRVRRGAQLVAVRLPLEQPLLDVAQPGR